MKIPTWYVITGGPNSGKTTTINHLAKLGYHTTPEYARVYMGQELAKGKTIEEIRKDEVKFQVKITKGKIQFEKKAPKNKIVFFDRGLPDSIAYYKFLKIQVPKKLIQLSKNRYKKVFLLDVLPYKKDYARIETEKEAKLIHKIIKLTYKELDYDVIKIPVMSVEERIETIIKNVR